MRYQDTHLLAPETLTVAVRAEGQSRGRWSAEHGHVDFAGGGAAMRFVVNADVNFRPLPQFTLPFDTSSISASLLGSGSYQCRRDDLDITTDGSPLGTIHWLRVS